MADAGVADGGPAGDEDEHAAIGQIVLELESRGLRSGVVRGKHRARSGFLEIGAEVRFVFGFFLDEPGDFAPVEGFLKVGDLLEIQATGNHENAGGRDPVLVEQMGG